MERLESFFVDDHSFDTVIEASGHPSRMGTCLEKRKAAGGTLVLKSTYHGTINFNSAALVINEVTVLGSRCGRFEPALRLMEQGLIDLTPLISDIFSINKVEEAFRKSLEKDSLKVLVKIP